MYLIGAGPGDPDLLTLKAARTLGEVDVVVLDDLVDVRVLDFAPRARVIHAGKRGGCRSTPQEFIERKLIQLARQGLCVGRVKGGDPYMFGRGAEEVAALEEAGIEVEVINGISAGIAAPAVIGVPLTHRDHAHGVTFVTAHTSDRGEPNWNTLARSGMTLVIYMGISRLERIATGLLGAGLAPTTPCAVVQHASLPQQKVTTAALSELATATRSAGVGSPAIIIVGEVAQYARAVKGRRALAA